MARHAHTVEAHIQHGMNIIMIGYVINAENIFSGGFCKKANEE